MSSPNTRRDSTTYGAFVANNKPSIDVLAASVNGVPQLVADLGHDWTDIW